LFDFSVSYEARVRQFATPERTSARNPKTISLSQLIIGFSKGVRNELPILSSQATRNAFRAFSDCRYIGLALNQREQIVEPGCRRSVSGLTRQWHHFAL
jgi:hypothetical protein